MKLQSVLCLVIGTTAFGATRLDGRWEGEWQLNGKKFSAVLDVNEHTFASGEYHVLYRWTSPQFTSTGGSINSFGNALTFGVEDKQLGEPPLQNGAERCLTELELNLTSPLPPTIEGTITDMLVVPGDACKKGPVVGQVRLTRQGESRGVLKAGKAVVPSYDKPGVTFPWWLSLVRYSDQSSFAYVASIRLGPEPYHTDLQSTGSGEIKGAELALPDFLLLTADYRPTELPRFGVLEGHLDAHGDLSGVAREESFSPTEPGKEIGPFRASFDSR